MITKGLIEKIASHYKTQQEFADALGVSLITARRILKGKPINRLLTRNKILMLAKERSWR